MAFHITDNTSSLQSDIEQKSSIFLRLVTDEVVAEALTHTPKDTGRMRLDILKQVLGLSGKIIWGKNYAIYQEEKQFKHYTTPGTGPHFAENAIKKVIDRTSEIAKKAGLQ